MACEVPRRRAVFFLDAPCIGQFAFCIKCIRWSSQGTLILCRGVEFAMPASLIEKVGEATWEKFIHQDKGPRCHWFIHWASRHLRRVVSSSPNTFCQAIALARLEGFFPPSSSWSTPLYFARSTFTLAASGSSPIICGQSSPRNSKMAATALRVEFWEFILF